MQNKLGKSEISDFRLLLSARHASLRDQIRQELLQSDDERFRKIAGEVQDRDDMSVADLLVDINLAVIGHHIEELRDIEAAFRRIADDQYGLCTDCHQVVAVARLQAYPTAKRCVRCQRRYERSHRTKAGSAASGAMARTGR